MWFVSFWTWSRGLFGSVLLVLTSLLKPLCSAVKPLVDLNKGVKCSSSTLLWSVGWWQVGGRAASASSVSRSNIICPQWEVNENWGEPATELVWRVEGKWIFKYTWFWSADLSELSAFKHLVSKLKDQKSDVMNLVGWFDVWSVGWNPVHDLIITCNTFIRPDFVFLKANSWWWNTTRRAGWMDLGWLVLQPDYTNSTERI